MIEDPTVSVENPVVESTVIRDLLVVVCSEHGEITDWSDADGDSKRRLQRRARDHARDAHDGLVEAKGWART